jgi:hypothetical protein
MRNPLVRMSEYTLGIAACAAATASRLACGPGGKMGWPGQLALEADGRVAGAEWDDRTAGAWEATLGWLPHDVRAAEMASKRTASDLFSIA